MNHRLRHDCAFQMARALLHIVGPCIMECEHREVMEEFYRACLSGIEDYEVQRERMLHRLRPMQN